MFAVLRCTTGQAVYHAASCLPPQTPSPWTKPFYADQDEWLLILQVEVCDASQESDIFCDNITYIPRRESCSYHVAITDFFRLNCNFKTTCDVNILANTPLVQQSSGFNHFVGVEYANICEIKMQITVYVVVCINLFFYSTAM